MDIDLYQERALQYRLSSADDMYAVLGLLSEAGEVADKYAKAIRDGTKADFKDEVVKELGDVMWMVAAIANDLDATLNEVAATNLAKLYNRRLNNKIQGSGDNR